MNYATQNNLYYIDDITDIKRLISKAYFDNNFASFFDRTFLDILSARIRPSLYAYNDDKKFLDIEFNIKDFDDSVIKDINVDKDQDNPFMIIYDGKVLETLIRECYGHFINICMSNQFVVNMFNGIDPIATDKLYKIVYYKSNIKIKELVYYITMILNMSLPGSGKISFRINLV